MSNVYEAKASTGTEPKERDIVITRAFDAPLEQVWKAWSEPEYVKQWWGPDFFSCPLATIDFRQGGVSLVCMRAPQEFGGQDMYNTWSYQEITPMKRIDFLSHFTDKDGQRIDPKTLGLHPDLPNEVRTVVAFTPLGDRRTELTITEYGFTSEQIIDLSRTGMEQCLGKMAAIFARG